MGGVRFVNVCREAKLSRQGDSHINDEDDFEEDTDEYINVASPSIISFRRYEGEIEKRKGVDE